MAWVWTVAGVSGLLLAAFCFTAAIVLYASNARNLQNQRLIAIDGAFFGLGAAVALGLALRSVEGVAQRVADMAVPRVDGGERYARERKRDVYRTALDELATDGSASEEERGVLERLRARLALADEDARAVEAERRMTGAS